jgi:flagellar motility protein MotE (MotC chaperone)
MDHEHLTHLRRHHPAWRLLAAEHAPVITGFLYRAFVRPNVRVVSEQTLASQLDDYIYHLRERLGEDAFPRPALEYLNAWAEEGRGFLRRFYPPDSDEPHFDLTPATERVIQWLLSLEQQRFVGAESRLKVIFDLLRQIAEGSETNPDVRLLELQRRRAAIDAEIDGVRAGRFSIMDDTQLRERFLQAAETARALLSDFRQVEQNFRELDRQVRERIATWEGGKGEVLEAIFGERDAISESDQGRSFRAFWDFLMSPARQEELTTLLERILELDPVAELHPDPRLRRVHYDWLTAGEATQRTVARLSEQLRRYLDDQAWYEDRRIMTVIREVEQAALAVRDNPPCGSVMELDEPSPKIELPMDRPLFTRPARPVITQHSLDEGDADVDASVLFEQFYVDKERLRSRVRQALQTRRQIGLEELLESHPLEQGLAELVAWLSLATGEGYGVIDEGRTQQVTWMDSAGRERRATLPTVIFVGEHQTASIHKMSVDGPA